MDHPYRYLSTIVNPTDLHKFSDKELLEVAAEVRRAILDKVSQTGGHFSSNLGTVELTVALYAAYSIPPDKVIDPSLPSCRCAPAVIQPRFRDVEKSGRTSTPCSYCGTGWMAIFEAKGRRTARERHQQGPAPPALYS